MSTFNHHTREITCKLVYYGPGLSGKTTNLRHIYARTRPDLRGNMVSLETDSERTLFFDFFPLTLGEITGYKVRLHLYTVPGQLFYYASRKLIIRNADGFVFVADSQADRMEANIESLEDLYVHLEDNRMLHLELPLVLQCNKRDIHEPVAIAELRGRLGLTEAPTFAAAAATGVGVFETLEALGKIVFARIRQPRRTG